MKPGRFEMRGLVAGLLLCALWLVHGTFTNPDFWFSADQRGDRLLAQRQYQAAQRVYQDPWRLGVAQYRNGDFEQAAATFARVPGASGAFDRGNAQFMQGDYPAAIDSYQRALEARPGWREAQDNIALARARQALLDNAGANREQESAGAHTPDETVFDQKGDDGKSQPPSDMNQQSLSDEALRASWLRRVQTTPGDFLRAKFAYQAAHQQAAGAGDAAGGGQ